LFPAEARRRDPWRLAWDILPNRRAFDWNQALFDFGAAVCTAARPSCEVCPVAARCPSAFKISPQPAKRSNPEPGRNGIPNRLYRGRIVDILRTLKGKRTVSADSLGSRIKENFTLRDRNWLNELLHALQRDGLVALRNGSSKLRVSLAE
jgi:A/G-specific adenine glycosylase